jgi:cytochrome c oxidase cbb3-type subunit 3
MSTFWSLWIIILTVVCTGGVCWILFANRRGKPHNADNTTGHEYDGIVEYDNPLPAWWFYMFVITIVFGVGYLIAYPGMGSFKGVLNWTSAGETSKDLTAAQQEFGPLFAKYAAMPLPEVAKDPAALKMGQRLFLNNCAQCHGSDGLGNKGFPNLTDSDWLYGGEPEQIIATIAHGRQGAMPGWTSALGDAGIAEVSAYIVSLSGREADTKLATAGAQRFAMFCAACHGADGKGNIAMGAPNLTDRIWLYGGSMSDIQQTLHNGRNGVMPAWNDILGADKVHLVAAYVYSLSRAQE